ncbi:hypothetical protein SKAU_G00414920 [Synaphobranchus kaupii]|uniref:HECT domain-containing protein n=1 Tax=Synaphobranchus kaupii TaxID=118154 RepID=A0A9Q1E743_SYNKA|nr:hypothetical protein SKAU_G00414920 [Synaphobranchus kaupii]
MGVLSDMSSDDDDLNQALLASMVESQMITSNKRCRFNINRSKVLDGALRGFKRPSYDPNAMMVIKFSDDMGQEEAVDLGGPRREFLRLLMEALMLSPMFEGGSEHQNLALDGTGNGFDQCLSGICGLLWIDDVGLIVAVSRLTLIY